MNNRTIEKLLMTKTADEFFETISDDTGILIDETLTEDIIENIDMWDKKVLEHCLNLTGFSYEQLKEQIEIDELD